VYLSALLFERQFARFNQKIREHSEGRAFTSFREGLPARWEDYKEDVRKNALRRLDVGSWKPSDVGAGRILERTIAAIEIHDPHLKLRNNLVAWQPRYGPASQAHRALLNARSDKAACRAVEDLLLRFFQGSVDEAGAFLEFCQLAGRRYDVIAYLFFLKDWTRFMPIAPTIFDEAFRELDIALITARRCSWENYSRFNHALAAVQQALRDVAGVEDARLIDAHSFCWMLVRLEAAAPAPPPHISVPSELTALRPFSRQSSSVDRGERFAVLTEDDFAGRDVARRRIGRLAQDVALRSERERLRKAGHPRADEAVQPVWDEPARGFDILSREIDGTPRHIEVKAVREAGEALSFFVSTNELKKSRSLPNYHFYLVRGADSLHPTVLAARSDLVTMDCLTPVNYLASVSELRTG